MAAVVPTSAMRPCSGPTSCAFADEHDAEGLAAVEAAIDHEPIALLEDVQRQRHARTEHGAEREERRILDHVSLRPDEGTQKGEPAGLAFAAGSQGQADQWWQAPGEPADSSVRKLLPQPQPETALGLLTVKPAPMSVST